MIARAWWLPIAAAQAGGFLTLTPPDEAMENLGLWWTLLASWWP